jgi:hypothetical protein
LVVLLVGILACGGDSPTTTLGEDEDDGLVTETTVSLTIGGDTEGTDAPVTGTPSGDCETDIAALEPIIEQKVLISNVSAEESTYVTGLISYIGAYCDDAVADEFFARPEVEEFMSG